MHFGQIEEESLHSSSHTRTVTAEPDLIIEGEGVQSNQCYLKLVIHFFLTNLFWGSSRPAFQMWVSLF